MLKKTLVLTLVFAILATALVFADGSQSVLSKVTGLSDEQITALNQNHRGFGRILTASIVAKLTNTKVEDVLKAQQAGATFFEIAEKKGIELDQYQEAIKNGKFAYIDEQVKAGLLTEDQAKLIKERMVQQIENCTGEGNDLGRGNCAGFGMRGFGRGQGGNGFRQGNGFNQTRSLLNQ